MFTSWNRKSNIKKKERKWDINFLYCLHTHLYKKCQFIKHIDKCHQTSDLPSLVCPKRRSQCCLNGTIFLEGWKELISASSWCCVFLASHWIEIRSEWKSKLTLPGYDNTCHTGEINDPQSSLHLLVIYILGEIYVFFLL